MTGWIDERREGGDDGREKITRWLVHTTSRRRRSRCRSLEVGTRLGYLRPDACRAANGVVTWLHWRSRPAGREPEHRLKPPLVGRIRRSLTPAMH